MQYTVLIGIREVLEISTHVIALYTVYSLWKCQYSNQCFAIFCIGELYSPRIRQRRIFSLLLVVIIHYEWLIFLYVVVTNKCIVLISENQNIPLTYQLKFIFALFRRFSSYCSSISNTNNRPRSIEFKTEQIHSIVCLFYLTPNHIIL